MLGNTKSANEITTNEAQHNIPLNSNTSSDTVIPIEPPPVLIYREALEVITPDDEHTQTIDNDAQDNVVLSRTSSLDNINSCFDELADQ